MLKVTMEIIPFGKEDHPQRREIGTLTIGLQRIKDDNIGEYRSTMTTDGKYPPYRPVIFIKHPCNEGAFELVKLAMTAHLSLEETPPEIVDNVQVGLATYEGPICAACGSTADLIGCEYTYDHPNYYDGISQYNCSCGASTGRWTGKILQPDESERPFGRA